ncbi:hypothetical protein [Streptomyces enissocaesilis]|uniref:Uncharacterized protein n=1 Tax=Streptomyces enissocaesilis TaxID=332589 RepID=A0ABN3X6X6_9ACTN
MCARLRPVHDRAAEPDPAPVVALADVRVTGRAIRVTREDGSPLRPSPRYCDP